VGIAPVVVPLERKRPPFPAVFFACLHAFAIALVVGAAFDIARRAAALITVAVRSARGRSHKHAGGQKQRGHVSMWCEHKLSPPTKGGSSVVPRRYVVFLRISGGPGAPPSSGV